MDSLHDSPWVLFADAQHEIARQCEALRQLVHRVAAEGVASDDLRARLVHLTRAFRAALALHGADQQQDLFPGLHESMAGSDAICIRQIEDGIRAEHGALAAQWSRVRATLEALAVGVPVQPPLTDVEALAALCARHIEFEQAELLPMAERLLGDEAVAHMRHAMHARRHAHRPHFAG